LQHSQQQAHCASSLLVSKCPARRMEQGLRGCSFEQHASRPPRWASSAGKHMHDLPPHRYWHPVCSHQPASYLPDTPRRQTLFAGQQIGLVRDARGPLSYRAMTPKQPCHAITYRSSTLTERNICHACLGGRHAAQAQQVRLAHTLNPKPTRAWEADTLRRRSRSASPMTPALTCGSSPVWRSTAPAASATYWSVLPCPRAASSSAAAGCTSSGLSPAEHRGVLLTVLPDLRSVAWYSYACDVVPWCGA